MATARAPVKENGAVPSGEGPSLATRRGSLGSDADKMGQHPSLFYRYSLPKSDNYRNGFTKHPQLISLGDYK